MVNGFVFADEDTYCENCLREFLVRYSGDAKDFPYGTMILDGKTESGIHQKIVDYLKEQTFPYLFSEEYWYESETNQGL